MKRIILIAALASAATGLAVRTANAQQLGSTTAQLAVSNMTGGHAAMSDCPCCDAMGNAAKSPVDHKRPITPSGSLNPKFR